MSLEEAERVLERKLEKYSEIFNDEIGCVNHYQHKIEVTSERAYKAKTYPIPEIHKAKVEEHLLQLEKQGIIERTATQYINPLVVVIKKTDEIRLCLDACELNKRCVNDHNQPPTIDEVFRRIEHKKYFSTLYVSKAFWQIPCDVVAFYPPVTGAEV